MKNEGSNSLTNTKSTHLKIALLFGNSKIFLPYFWEAITLVLVNKIFNYLIDSENLEPKPIMNMTWASWFGYSDRRESQNKKGAPRIRGPRDEKLKSLIFQRILFKLGPFHFFNIRNWCQTNFWCLSWFQGTKRDFKIFSCTSV